MRFRAMTARELFGRLSGLAWNGTDPDVRVGFEVVGGDALTIIVSMGSGIVTEARHSIPCVSDLVAPEAIARGVIDDLVADVRQKHPLLGA